MLYPPGIKNPLGMLRRASGLPRSTLTHADTRLDFSRRKLKKFSKTFLTTETFLTSAVGEIVGPVTFFGKGSDGGKNEYFDHYYYNRYRRTYDERKSDGAILNDTGYLFYDSVNTGNDPTKPADYCVMQDGSGFTAYKHTCWQHSGLFYTTRESPYAGTDAHAFGIVIPGGASNAPAEITSPQLATIVNGNGYEIVVPEGGFVTIECMIIDTGE